MMKVRTSDLQLADRVVGLTAEGEPNISLGPCTVKQIKNKVVTFLRVYVQTADFSYTGGVICTIGYEEFAISADNVGEWLLLARKELK